MSKEKYQKQWEAMSQRIEKAEQQQDQQQQQQQQQQEQQQDKQQQQQQDQQQQQEQQHGWGYNIGIRLVDEFLAKSGIGACGGFRETAEVIAKLGLRMFLGVSAEVTNWDVQERSCSLVLSENPLADFVELPPSLANLNYCNLICGVIRGALEQLRMRVACYFVKDMLKGDDVYEIKLELKELMKEEFEDDEDS
ncbi:hypothetical protein Emed_003103 [Eimeria media]